LDLVAFTARSFERRVEGAEDLESLDGIEEESDGMNVREDVAEVGIHQSFGVGAPTVVPYPLSS
jgi:hypothetical protein